MIKTAIQSNPNYPNVEIFDEKGEQVESHNAIFLTQALFKMSSIEFQKKYGFEWDPPEWIKERTLILFPELKEEQYTNRNNCTGEQLTL